MKFSLPALCVAALAASAFAAPKYYTFTGTVIFVVQDQGGYAAAHNIKSGSAVTYVFAVDVANNGYSLLDGKKTDMPDSIMPTPGHKTDYFYDSLTTASVFSAAFPATQEGTFFGYHSTTTYGSSTLNSAVFQSLIGLPEHGTQIIINIPDTSSVDFLPKLNAAVTATENYVDSTAANSSVSMTMKLTAISDTKPSNGVRPVAATGGAWLRAAWNGGSLVVRNGSGRPAHGALLDAAGKTMKEFALGETAMLPPESLPEGFFVLKATTEGGAAAAAFAAKR